MFGQPSQPSPYDVHFSVLGIPVRVMPIFWLSAAFLTWVGGRLDYTLVGIVAVFVSILVHELGHALTTRRLGGRSQIVLGFMGGYATTISHSRMGNILIAAAGPAAGLALWLIVRVVLQSPFGLTLKRGSLFSFFLTSLEWMNLIWSLLNLLPIWPLDGGQIAREVIGRFRTFDAWEVTLKLSIVVAVGAAVWFIHGQVTARQDNMLPILFFGLMAFQNFQNLQMSGRGRW